MISLCGKGFLMNKIVNKINSSKNKFSINEAKCKIVKLLARGLALIYCFYSIWKESNKT